MKWIAVSVLSCCGCYLTVHGFNDRGYWLFIFALAVAIFSESRYLWKKDK